MDHVVNNLFLLLKFLGTCEYKSLINERVELLFNMLINIFRNYIPDKKVKFKYGKVP